MATCKGKQWAAVAVGHSILTIVYHVLRSHEEYRELGVDYIETRNKEALVKQTVCKLENLGFLSHISTSSINHCIINLERAWLSFFNLQ
jgi:hypothetical protein